MRADHLLSSAPAHFNQVRAARCREKMKTPITKSIAPLDAQKKNMKAIEHDKFPNDASHRAFIGKFNECHAIAAMRLLPTRNEACDLILTMKNSQNKLMKLISNALVSMSFMRLGEMTNLLGRCCESDASLDKKNSKSPASDAFSFFDQLQSQVDDEACSSMAHVKVDQHFHCHDCNEFSHSNENAHCPIAVSSNNLTLQNMILDDFKKEELSLKLINAHVKSST